MRFIKPGIESRDFDELIARKLAAIQAYAPCLVTGPRIAERQQYDQGNSEPADYREPHISIFSVTWLLWLHGFRQNEEMKRERMDFSAGNKPESQYELDR
jgi:hypothetical protein